MVRALPPVSVDRASPMLEEEEAADAPESAEVMALEALAAAALAAG